FVHTIKRDYVRVSPRPDAETVMRQLPAWMAHYAGVHPHTALGYRSPREFIAAHARPCPRPVARGRVRAFGATVTPRPAIRSRHPHTDPPPSLCHAPC